MNNEDRRKYGEVLKGVVQELSRTMECVSSCLIDLKYGSVWNNTILCAENHARAAATLLERLDDLAMGQTVPVEPPDKKATYDSGRTLAHEILKEWEEEREKRREAFTIEEGKDHA